VHRCFIIREAQQQARHGTTKSHTGQRGTDVAYLARASQGIQHLAKGKLGFVHAVLQTRGQCVGQ
jgi:hypothetical protein